MLLNCTNHPCEMWNEPLMDAAKKQYGEIVDLPFPFVSPGWSIHDLREEVEDYAARIEAFQADAVLAAGEFTFLFMLVDKLLADGVNVICSCSRRNTVEVKNPDGSNEKKSVFFFEGFRPYARYQSQEAAHG